MFHVEFDIDPTWFKEQQNLERLSRPPGSRIKKDRERLLVGYVDGVLILAFPRFQVSTVSPGTGEGWFSLNPIRLGSCSTRSRRSCASSSARTPTASAASSRLWRGASRCASASTIPSLASWQLALTRS